MRRPSLALLASLVLLGGLVAGCDNDSSKGAETSTSRTGGAAGATTSTMPLGPGRFVAVWSGEDKDIWALTTEPCPRPGFDSARCGVVSHTTDGGTAWTRLARLDVGTAADFGTDFVSDLHFADAEHGWVYNRSLFATFNGGKRWQRVDLGNPVVALVSTGTSVYALVGSCAFGAGSCAGPMRLSEGTIATGRWRFLTPGFDLPTTDAGTLVLARSGVYAVIYQGLEQMLLARTSSGRWERRTLPCPRAVVAAIEAQDGLVTACRPQSPAAPVELQTSSDGGKTWAVVWQHTFASQLTSLAVAGQATVVALENGDVARSTDNGVNFSTVLQAGGAAGVEFSDAEHGLVHAGPSGQSHVFRTSDGGMTWHPVAPPP